MHDLGEASLPVDRSAGPVQGIPDAPDQEWLADGRDGAEIAQTAGKVDQPARIIDAGLRPLPVQPIKSNGHPGRIDRDRLFAGQTERHRRSDEVGIGGGGRQAAADRSLRLRPGRQAGDPVTGGETHEDRRDLGTLGQEEVACFRRIMPEILIQGEKPFDR